MAAEPAARRPGLTAQTVARTVAIALTGAALLLLPAWTWAADPGPQPGSASGNLRVAGPVISPKSASRVYIVQLNDAPAVAAAHGGGATGASAARRGGPRVMQLRNAASADSHSQRIEARHDRLLADVGAAGSKLYSYRYSFNGFAARLTPQQLAALRASGEVRAVFEDRMRELRSGATVGFLGLTERGAGLDAAEGLQGEGMIIGIIDSGIAPDHPSLADTDTRPLPGLCRGQWGENTLLGRWLCRRHRHAQGRVVYDPPNGWNGECVAGPGFGADSCNNKLIGARFYNEGFLAANELHPNEFRSPRDADGHGTHVATLAAGNPVDARLAGSRIGRIRGIAPRAHVAVYKACWLRPEDTRAICSTSDLARAIDDAVADGVHVINYSIGNPAATLTAADDLALLYAADAGVFTAVAAGNEGPGAATLGSPAVTPWVTTVAASSRAGERFDTALRVTAPSSLVGDYVMQEGALSAPLADRDPVVEALVLADDGVERLPDGSAGSTWDACQPLRNAGALSDRVALIERGGCTFQTKLLRAQSAGAAAVVVVNNQSGPPITMIGEDSVDIPAVMISQRDGRRLYDALAEGREVRVELGQGRLRRERTDGNVMGDFSSRGPNPTVPDLIKPDLTAPGVDMLGGHTPDVATGIRDELYQYISGTSQSAPVVAGLAALIRQRHPDWSPAMIKSALMTTAYTDDVVRHDGETPADPFDRGAGHVAPNLALDPGLAYDAELADYTAFLCGLDDPPFSDAECAELVGHGHSVEARDLNLPSIGIAGFVGRETVRRRVTGVGPARQYTAQIDAPPGLSVSVNPSMLSLADGQTAEFELTLDAGATVELNRWNFGRLTWHSDDGVRAASPIAVRPIALHAPRERHFSGVSGLGSFEVRTGYAGSYAARAHGLRMPLIIDGFVDQDPDRNFSFRFDDGVTLHLIDIPPDQAYARFALFDEYTDGDDDLDLYLFFCPTDTCVQVGESARLDSNEEVNLRSPAPGRYAALVHGYDTDPSTGPGAEYLLLAWSFGFDDDLGNMTVTAPGTVSPGDSVQVDVAWSDLETESLHLGGVSHETPEGSQGLTVIRVDTR